MIYEGIFENRNAENIVVKINTGGDSETVGTTGAGGLTLSNDGLNTTVHSKKFRLVKGIVFETYPTGDINDRFVTIRMYKGFTYKFQAPTPTIASMYPYDFVATTLNNKVVTSQMGISTVTYSYKAVEDGYIYLNLNSRHYLQMVRLGWKLKDLIFSGDPVTINQNSDDGIYSPLKLSSATIRIMTPSIYTDLYSSTPTAVSVDITNNNNRDYLFKGYVTPAMYSQKYTHPYDELEIECVSPVSALDFKKWEPMQDNIVTWYSVLKKILSPYYDGFYIHNSFLFQGNRFWVEELAINQDAFKDGEEEYLTEKAIIEEFCKTFSLSCVTNGREVYFADYSLIYEDNQFSYYDFSDDQPMDLELGGITYLSDNPNEAQYVSNDQTVSFDEVYGKIEVTSNQESEDENLINFEDDNLICIHPNIPYIKYTVEPNSTESHLYYLESGQNKRHTDLYRFYIMKDMDHYYYESTFNPPTEVGYIYKGIYDTIYPTSSEPNFKTEFIDRFFRKNLCCFVVKHMSWVETDEGGVIADRAHEYEWETFLMISYGIPYLSEASVEYSGNLTTLLKMQYQGAAELPILRCKNDFRLLPIPNCRNYLQIDGSAKFMRYPMISDITSWNDSNLVKKLTVSQYNSGLYANVLFSLFDGNRAVGSTIIPWNPDTKWDDRDSLFKERLNYLYQWKDGEQGAWYTQNVIQPKGILNLFSTPTSRKLSMRPPTPMFVENNVAPCYVCLKDIEISQTRDWPIEIAIKGEIPEDTTVRAEASTQYLANDKLEINLRFSSQSSDLMPNIGSILYVDNNYGYSYLLHVNREGLNKSLEEIVMERYYNHYKDPKLVYECTIDNSFGIFDTIVPMCLGKDMLVDEIEYNVLHNIKTVRLIER